MPVITNRKNGPKGKLLVVDDDEALRRLMHLELSESYEVIDTGEPEQGLALGLPQRNRKDIPPYSSERGARTIACAVETSGQGCAREGL